MVLSAWRLLGGRTLRDRGRLIVACAFVTLLAACDDKAKPAEAVRPVRTTVVQEGTAGETLSAVGEIKARYEVDLGFRIAGKVNARPVEVGTQVTPGTLLAALDDEPKQNELRSAKAAVSAADAEATRATAEEARERELMQQGFATRQRYDMAMRDLQTAQAQLASARAQLTLADEAVDYTSLRADSNGVVSAVFVDSGEVVTSGQKIVRIAQTDQREAVFNVPETLFDRVPRDIPVEVSLVSNPEIAAHGTARYISPEADTATRTFLVRIALPDAPHEMRLGSTVEGRVTLPSANGFTIPSSALFEADGKPAVWLFDTATQTVALTPVTVQRYDRDKVVLGGGLKGGEIVVTAGVHLLRPGQRVRQLAAAQ